MVAAIVRTQSIFCVKQLGSQPRSQGPLSTSRKYPGCGWSRVYSCQPKPHREWFLNLILSTLFSEVNITLLYRRYFEKEVIKLFVRDPALPAASDEYEMVIERELCLYFTAFFK